MKPILFLSLFLSLKSYCQLDTFKIYQDSSGIKFKLYLKAWFPKTQSYSYSDSQINKQDSLAMSFGNYYGKQYYLKVLDKKQRLIIEGIKGEYGDLIGKVKHYFKNGQVKRIENYEIIETEVIDSTIYGLSDRYGPSGNWKHFSKKGKIKKEENYFLKKNQKSPVKIHFIHEIILYNKKGEVKSKNTIVLNTFPS